MHLGGSVIEIEFFVVQIPMASALKYFLHGGQI